MYRRAYCGLRPSHAPEQEATIGRKEEKKIIQNEIHGVRSGHESEGPEDYYISLSLSVLRRTTVEPAEVGLGFDAWEGHVETSDE